MMSLPFSYPKKSFYFFFRCPFRKVLIGTQSKLEDTFSSGENLSRSKLSNHSPTKKTATTYLYPQSPPKGCSFKLPPPHRLEAIQFSKTLLSNVT